MKLLLSLVMVAAGLASQTLTPVDQVSYPKVIAAHKGRMVLANFWATWRVPCRKELPAGFLYDRSGQELRSFFGETAIADREAAITKLL